MGQPVRGVRVRGHAGLAAPQPTGLPDGSDVPIFVGAHAANSVPRSAAEWPCRPSTRRRHRRPVVEAGPAVRDRGCPSSPRRRHIAHRRRRAQPSAHCPGSPTRPHDPRPSRPPRPVGDADRPRGDRTLGALLVAPPWTPATSGPRSWSSSALLRASTPHTSRRRARSSPSAAAYVERRRPVHAAGNLEAGPGRCRQRLGPRLLRARLAAPRCTGPTTARR